MTNLYIVAKKVILINPFSTPYKNVPYTALFYHTMTLKQKQFRVRNNFYCNREKALTFSSAVASLCISSGSCSSSSDVTRCGRGPLEPERLPLFNS